MRHHPLLLLAPLAVTLAVCIPAAAADTVVAQLERPSTIRSYAGIQVLSAHDGNAYRLAVLRRGRIEILPVAPSQAPFDVDIGPDRTGRPQLVYTRCRVERPDVAMGRNDSQGCDLVSFGLDGLSGERPVRGASTPDGNEFAPTLWKGRIAFARKVPGRERPLVLLRDLGAPRSRPSPTQWIAGGGPLRPGIYRYRVATADLGRAPDPRGALSIVGLALAGPDTAYLTDASPTENGCGGGPEGMGPARLCQVIRTGPLRFRPVGPRAA